MSISRSNGVVNHNHFNNHIRSRSEVSHTSYDDEAPINRKLPKELLLRIFSYLDVVSLCRCAQVSKFWNVLALDGSNWQRVDLFQFQVDVKAPVVENIAKRCGGFLKSLSLKGCQNITDDALQRFAEQCRNIEELNLNNCKKITDLTCESLGNYSKKLLHLDLSSCLIVTDKSLKAISDGCHSLEHINISWCKEITNDGLLALAMGCKKLKDFICTGCGQTKSTCRVFQNLVWFLSVSNYERPSLSPEHRCYYIPDTKLSSVQVGATGSHILFNKLIPITDAGIGHIGKNCEHIAKINLHSCQNISDEAIQMIGEHCHDLLSLCVSSCQRLTDVSLIALSLGCHNLRTLEAACCSHFTDNGFQALAKNCVLLEKMDLEECIQITDNTLNYLGAYCHNLTALSLSHCELITDEGIRHLGSSPCATEHLSILELDNCPLITDASLEHLMGCQGLERIELYDCQLITRTGIRRLKTRLPNIKVHAYFAPVTPPPSVGNGRQRYCKCCTIL